MDKDDGNLNDPGFSNHTPMMHGRKARDFIGFPGAFIDDLHCHLHLPDKGELAKITIGHVLALDY